MNEQNTIRFFDMFAGIGGLRAGFPCQSFSMAGNAVPVNVVRALGLRIKAAYMAGTGAGAEKEAT